MLNRWWLKAAVQGGLAALPGSRQLDERLRRLRRPRLTESYALGKWTHVEQHLRAVDARAGEPLTDLRVIELGTGWFPIVPLGLALHGADVITIDKNKHLDPQRVRLTLQVAHDLVLAGRVPTASTERVALLAQTLAEDRAHTVPELLGPLGISSHIADATDLGSVPGAAGADLLVSNNTLEHIPAEVLRDIFAAFHQVGAAGARMSHYIDLADHYAGVDPRINEFHFLTLGPRRWGLANNDLGYQNRLRITDYRDVIAQSGWRVTDEHLTRRKAAQLDGLDLVPPYDRLPPEDLLVVKAHLVAGR